MKGSSTFSPLYEGLKDIAENINTNAEMVTR